MYYLKRNSVQLFFLVLVLFFNNAQSNDKLIKISNIKLDYEASNYWVSYDQHIPLSPDTLNAISKGIPLYFKVSVNIFENSYGFNKIKLSNKMYTKLKYKSLLRTYVITDIHGKKSYFENVDDALKKISHVDNLKIGQTSKMESGMLEIEIKLDKKYLPKALQINANSASWDLSSEVVKYNIGIL